MTDIELIKKLRLNFSFCLKERVEVYNSLRPLFEHIDNNFGHDDNYGLLKSMTYKSGIIEFLNTSVGLKIITVDEFNNLNSKFPNINDEDFNIYDDTTIQSLLSMIENNYIIEKVPDISSIFPDSQKQTGIIDDPVEL